MKYTIVVALLIAFPLPALIPSPAAWWPLDETSGIVADDASGNHRHAEMTAVIWAPESGQVDGAAQFNGQDSVGAFFMPDWSALSFAGWFLFSGNGNSGYPRLLDTGTFRFGVVRDAPGEPNRGIFVAMERESGTVDYRTPAGAVPDTEWVHLVVVIDSSNTANDPRVYVNGMLQTLNLTSARSTTPMLAKPLTAQLGNNLAGTRGFHGLMDEVRLYTREVTLAEIRELAGLPPPVGEAALEDFNTARPAIAQPIDFDGDGLPDLVEHACGFDRATAGEVNPFVTWETDQHPVRLRYERVFDANRFGSVVEASSDLIGWSLETVNQEVFLEPTPDGKMEVTVEIDLPGPTVFARLRAFDRQEMQELTFQNTRDLFAKLAQYWQSQVNAAGTADVYGSAFDYEWVTRMLFPIAAWLSRPGRSGVLSVGDETVDLGAILWNALVNGTDPTHPDRWPSPSNQWDQIVVEAPQVSLAAWLLYRANMDGGPGGVLWDSLTAEHRANLQAFLAATGNPAFSYHNNWNLFITLNHGARKQLDLAGVNEFDYTQTAIDDSIRKIQDMHQGGGWYADSNTEPVFDDYLAYVILPEQMMFFVLEAALTQAETIIPDTGGRGRAEILADISKWLSFQVLSFDAWGGHPEFGRSSTYTFSRLRPLVMAYVIDRIYNTPEKWNLGFKVLPEDISPGMLRRLIRIHLNHYLVNGIIDPATHALLNGQTPESADGVLESYTHDGSRYWAMNTFAALFLLPNDDPLWSTAEQPLPSETTAYESWHEIPGFLLRSTPSAGHLELFNARVPKNSWMGDEYYNKYTKFTYSSRFGYLTRDGGRLDQNIQVGDEYRRNPDTGSYFIPADREVAAPGILRTSHYQGAARIDTLIFFKEGSQLRVHRVSGASGKRIRDGGYPLGHGDGETPPEAQVGNDWIYMESSVGAMMVRCVTGFTSAGILSGSGNHSRHANWRLPYAELATASASPEVVAVFHHASAIRFNPVDLAARVVSVTIDGLVVTVEWNDGDTVSAEFD